MNTAVLRVARVTLDVTPACLARLDDEMVTQGLTVPLTIPQGIIFMFQYLGLRGECQEAYYNLGRAFHQLGWYRAFLA